MAELGLIKNLLTNLCFVSHFFINFVLLFESIIYHQLFYTSK